MSQKTVGPAETAPSDKQVELSPTMLLGKTALVTGASRGIGASVARQLGQLGADVAINYRSKGPRAQEVADELAAMGERPFSFRATSRMLRTLPPHSIRYRLSGEDSISSS